MSLELHQYCELLSLGIVLICMPRLIHSSYAWALPYMAIVVFIELVAPQLPLELHGSNHWLYNLYLPVQFSFFGFIIYNAYVSKSYKKLFAVAAFIFFVFCILNLLFFEKFFFFNTDTFLLSSLILILASGLMFLDIIKNDRPGSIYALSIFWFTLSCMVFFVGFSLFFSNFFFYLDSKEEYLDQTKIYSFIRTYVNLAHYLFLSIAILLVKRKNV